LMNNITRELCEGVERDQTIVRRFAGELQQHRVTHVLPMLEMLCLWVDAAKAHITSARPKYLVTFQGYELYSTYARSLNLEETLYQRLAEAVDRSDFAAIAVSEDYRHRVREELGVPLDKMVAIPPGVPAAQRMDAAKAGETLRTKFKEYSPDLPLIAFLGRRDTEKGIDLLLYAAKILAQRGMRFQLAICGPTLWGDHYGEVCRKIAEELRIPVMWRRFVPDDVRSALFSLAHGIVYPSIHREPFGMVAAESAAHGTPAIVPDYGGVASAIEANGQSAGLRFRAWDSGDLAEQIARLLQDRALHARLSEAGPRVAEYYSISNLADRVLAHIGLPPRA
jgi:glycosyltransferase involved in cell wall biosynthesis